MNKLKELLSAEDPSSERLDPNAKNRKGCTPLMLAAMGGHLPCVELLLKHGAQKEVRNKSGEDAKSVIGLHLSDLYVKDCEELVSMPKTKNGKNWLLDAQKLALKYIDKPRKHRSRKESRRGVSSGKWTLEDAAKRIINREKLEEALSY